MRRISARSDRELAEIEPAEFGGEDQASVVTARKQRFCFSRRETPERSADKSGISAE
jgi:hypothetical protein